MQVVTNLWPAVVVLSINFACRKLGSSSRKVPHNVQKLEKLVDVRGSESEYYLRAQHLTCWLVVARTDDRSLLPSQTHL